MPDVSFIIPPHFLCRFDSVIFPQKLRAELLRPDSLDTQLPHGSANPIGWPRKRMTRWMHLSMN